MTLLSCSVRGVSFCLPRMIFVKLCHLFYSMCSSLSSSNRLTIPVIGIVFTENVWPVYVCLDLYSNTTSISTSTSSRSFGRYSCISSICIWKSSDTDVDLGLDLYSTCKAYPPPPNLRSSDTVPSISFLLAGGGGGAVAVVDVTVDVAGIPLVVAVLAGAGTDATN